MKLMANKTQNIEPYSRDALINWLGAKPGKTKVTMDV